MTLTDWAAATATPVLPGQLAASLHVTIRVQGRPWDPQPNPTLGPGPALSPKKSGLSEVPEGPGQRPGSGSHLGCGHEGARSSGRGRYLRRAPRPACTCGSPARGSAQSPPGRCPRLPPRPPRRPPWWPLGGAHRQAGSCCSRAAPRPRGLGHWLGEGGPPRVRQRLWPARRPPGAAPGQRAPAAGSSCPPPRGSPGCPRTFLRRSRRCSSVTSQDSTAHQGRGPLSEGDPSSSRGAAHSSGPLTRAQHPAAAAAPGPSSHVLLTPRVFSQLRQPLLSRSVSSTCTCCPRP